MPATAPAVLDASFGAVPFGVNPRVTVSYLEQDHRNAMAQQWNLGVQKQLRGDFLVEATYIANVGHRLGGAQVNWNQTPLVNGQVSAKDSRQCIPFPQFTVVAQRSSDWGNSSYHSGNLKIEKRYSGGFNMIFNYTWAKYLDDIEGGSELAGLAGNGYQHYE